MLTRATSLVTLFVMVAPTVAAEPGPADPQSVEALMARVDVLRAKVATLRTAWPTEEDWLTEQRADEIHNLVHDVLADADTRTNMLQSGLRTGRDKSFFLTNADNTFRLEIAGHVQVRFAYNGQSGGPIDDHRWGFENRRTKLKFEGHVLDESWTFQVIGAFLGIGGTFFLDTGYITKTFDNGVAVRVGQFKPPFLREALISSSRQLAVERSLVNGEFDQGRAQGIEIGYKNDVFGIKGMYHDGFRSRGTAALAETTEFAFTARAEWLAAGSWNQFKDFTSWSGDELGVLIGGAIHYEKDEYGTAAGPENATFSWTVDGSVEFGGAHLYGAVVGRHLDVAGADQVGVVVQGGMFFVPGDWELFARYELADLDIAGSENLNVVTVGVNRYFARHGLKWTTDVGIAFDTIDSAFAPLGAGWRTDTVGEDSQIVIRSQLQLLF